MLRTVMPVRRASSPIVILPSGVFGRLGLGLSRPWYGGESSSLAVWVQREALPVHLPSRIRAEERDRLGDVLGRGEGREVLAGIFLPHARSQQGVDDDDVGGGAAGLEAVGEGEGPGLGGRLRGGVGGVGVRGRLWLLGRDEHEAPVRARGQLVVEGAGGVMDAADEEGGAQIPVCQ